MAPRKPATEEAGKPAAMSFGDTSEGIVFPSRLVGISVYTVAAAVEADRTCDSYGGTNVGLVGDTNFGYTEINRFEPTDRKPAQKEESNNGVWIVGVAHADVKFRR